MVGSEMSVPVFIPPRKRQTTKKANGTQNYVDHIVTVSSHPLQTHTHTLTGTNFLNFIRTAQSSHRQHYPAQMVA